MCGISCLWLFICCKTKLKKNIFFTKYTLFAEKKFLYGKRVLYWKFFFLKKNSFSDKNISENVKNYMSNLRNILENAEKYMQKMFVLQIKYKSFLNIYSFCKKTFFAHKKRIC